MKKANLTVRAEEWGNEREEMEKKEREENSVGASSSMKEGN